MVIKRSAKGPGGVRESEVTPKEHFLSRRNFLRAGLLGASAIATGGLYETLLAPSRKVRQSAPLAPDTVAASGEGAADTEKRNSYEEITTYNNFYEFSTDKYGVSERAAGFVSRPWTLAV